MRLSFFVFLSGLVQLSWATILDNSTNADTKPARSTGAPTIPNASYPIVELLASDENAEVASTVVAAIDPGTVATIIKLCMSFCDFRRAGKNDFNYVPSDFQYKYARQHSSTTIETHDSVTKTTTWKNGKRVWEGDYSMRIDYTSARDADGNSYVILAQPRVYGRGRTYSWPQSMFETNTYVEFKGVRSSQPYNKGSSTNARWAVRLTAEFLIKHGSSTESKSLSIEVEPPQFSPTRYPSRYPTRYPTRYPARYPTAYPTRIIACPLPESTGRITCLSNIYCTYSKTNTCVTRPIFPGPNPVVCAGKKAGKCAKYPNFCIWSRPNKECRTRPKLG